jgi:hypothetical protein
LIRVLRGGNSRPTEKSQVGYVPLDGKFPESLTRDLDTLVLQLWIGEIKTGISAKKP